MGSWIKRREGWISGHAKQRVNDNAQVQSPAQEAGVQVIVKIRCPQCRSDKVKQYGKDRSKGVLYYRCKEPGCKKTFKVIEKDTLQA